MITNTPIARQLSFRTVQKKDEETWRTSEARALERARVLLLEFLVPMYALWKIRYGVLREERKGK